MIEYDGYLDRSRLGPGVFGRGSLYSKRFFSDFQRVLLKNKKENLNTLTVNYQFTHEYKKIEYNDEMNNKKAFLSNLVVLTYLLVLVC